MSGSERVLVLGASGMLGSTLTRLLPKYGHETWGTVRGAGGSKQMGGVDALNLQSVAAAIQEIRPSVVVNCIGVIRQREDGQDPETCIALNALFPHQLAKLAARVIHVSTDCVFSGQKGSAYLESDFVDANDVYGRSKLLGELHAPHTLTLRTSIIGHEIRAKLSLLEWFLAQSGSVRGYTKAIYSGLTTVELARVIGEFVLPRPSLQGLYQVSSAPISKFDLLNTVKRVYAHTIEVLPNDAVVENKSLDSQRFRAATGWTSPSWLAMIEQMHQENLSAQ